jgi:MFS superfamily sulfate permease-like transporter
VVNRIPWRTWQPKLVESLARYDRHTLASDVVAGLTVGVVALPLAMAFGIASGVILLVLAVTGLGQAVKFIPRPVVLGFTNGIALLIASTQIKDFFCWGLATRPPSSSGA